MPTKPAWLSPAASGEWDRVADNLVADGLISRVDADVLAIYCETFAEYLDVAATITREGRTSKSPSGRIVVNPAHRIYDKAAARLLRLSSKMGMTPLGRAKLKQK